MICEKCQKEHDGSYGSGRFCNLSCAAGFSSNKNRKETNKKISASLKGKPTGRSNSRSFQHLSLEARKSMTAKAIEGQKRYFEKIYNESSWKDLPLSMKRRKSLKEQDDKCSICGIKEWNGKDIKLHYDHIDGNSKNESRENVRHICPNCHSQTDTYCGKKQNLPQFEYLKRTKERIQKNNGV